MLKALRPWWIAGSILVFTAAFLAPAGASEFSAGGFLFSDELGGFRLVSASGSGSAEDPIVLVEEFDDVQPATLVIRNLSLLHGRPAALTEFSLVKRIVNRSGRVWAAFELELQELPKRPSVYSDGLSFKQFGIKSDDVQSDSFVENERLFEPYDRIEFRNGHVDPDKTASFRVTITDPTPIPEFYLVQDPKLLSASLPEGRSFASSR